MNLDSNLGIIALLDFASAILTIEKKKHYYLQKQLRVNLPTYIKERELALLIL